MRIKCRDYVSKIALYRDRLAVLLPDRVHIYELTNTDNDYDMHYRTKEKSPCVGVQDSDHLGVVTNHVLLAKGPKVELLDFKMNKEREWTFEAPVTCMEVTGGVPGK